MNLIEHAEMAGLLSLVTGTTTIEHSGLCSGNGGVHGVTIRVAENKTLYCTQTRQLDLLSDLLYDRFERAALCGLRQHNPAELCRQLGLDPTIDYAISMSV